MAHNSVVFLHQWAVLPCSCCHMADSSFTWKHCTTNNVNSDTYKLLLFKNKILLGAALPVLFSAELIGACPQLFLCNVVSYNQVLHAAVCSMQDGVLMLIVVRDEPTVEGKD